MTIFVKYLKPVHIDLGFKHTDKWKKLKKRDCEFCFLVIVGWNMTIPRPDPMNAIEPTDLGSFQVINDWLKQEFGLKLINQ